MIRTETLSQTLALEVVGLAPEPAGAARRRVDEIWTAEKAKRGDALFDGELLSLVERRDSVLRARVVTYREHLAQLREPSLFGELGIRPLAVSGFVSSGGSIAFGRRGLGTTQDPGRWELVPSGGLEPRGENGLTDLILTQFFEELEEELGVARTWVESAEPFLLLEDDATHVVDIAVAATLSVPDLLPFAGAGDEYIDVRWVPREHVQSFCARVGAQDQIVEVSAAILKERGLL